MRLLRHPGAEEDILDAARWYDGQREGLGEKFVDALEQALIIVATRPRNFTAVPFLIPHHEVRRFVMRTYPYSIYFDVQRDQVVLMAVAHQRRQQDYWLSRLTT